MLDKRVRYLCKTEDNGTRVIFQWTPTLAVKKGMRPVSVEEAEAIQAEENSVNVAKRDAALGIVTLPDNNEVVEAVVESKLTPAEESKLNQGQPLVVTNADLLSNEITKIAGMTEKDEIEQYFLVKYRMELQAHESIEGMKKEATYALSQLANESKLYEAKK